MQIKELKMGNIYIIEDDDENISINSDDTKSEMEKINDFFYKEQYRFPTNQSLLEQQKMEAQMFGWCCFVDKKVELQPGQIIEQDMEMLVDTMIFSRVYYVDENQILREKQTFIISKDKETDEWGEPFLVYDEYLKQNPDLPEEEKRRYEKQEEQKWQETRHLHQL